MMERIKNVHKDFKGKIEKDQKQNLKSLKEIVSDNDPSHIHWRLQEGENFSKKFYFNQKKCPKTKDGKQICIKLFIRGICDKNCTRAHKLSKEEEKAFDDFINRCREGGIQKPDF